MSQRAALVAVIVAFLVGIIVITSYSIHYTKLYEAFRTSTPISTDC